MDVVDPSDLGRMSSLLDFLGDYYRLARPPVRSTTAYGAFLLRESDFFAPAGVQLTPGAESWLQASLVSHEPAPEIPRELIRFVRPTTLSPLEAPEASLGEAASDDDLAAAIQLEEWRDAVWAPWAERWRLIEQGRDFYKTLFGLRTELVNSRDSLELAWGFGRLRWNTSKGQIDYPLVTVAAELVLNDDILRVQPAGAAEIESAFLTEIDLADRQTFLAMRQGSEADEIELWSAESRKSLLERLLRPIDHDGTFEDRLRGRSSGASLTDEWVLFVRRREADYIEYLEDLRELYAGGTPPPLPFLSLVVADPSRFGDFSELGTAPAAGTVEDTTLFLPKAANEEQFRILKLAQARTGVTAQGPPGTGKSHTIANLVSHFVAEGKRVLVTSEKEQALAVLSEKLPPAVRDLSVSVLGSDAAARTRLEQAINSIQEKVSTYDQRFNTSERVRLTAALAAIDSKLAATSHQLRDARQAETTVLHGVFEVGSDPTPARVAEWLRAAQDELAIVMDAVRLDSPFPLTAKEWADLVELARQLSPTDAALGTGLLPRVDALPTGAQIHSRNQELAALREDLAAAETVVASWDRLDGASLDWVAAIAERIEDHASWLRTIASQWLERVRIESKAELTRDEWAEFASTLRGAYERAIMHRRGAASFEVRIDTSEDIERGLFEARQRFAESKGVSRLLHRRAYQAITAALVDGRRPSTVEQVDACISVLELRKTRRLIGTLWTNGVTRVGGPPLDETREAEDAVVSQIDQLDRCVAWYAQTWPDLRSALGAVDVHSGDDPTPDALQSIASSLRLLSVRVRERSLSVELSDMETYIRTAGGPTWTPLADAWMRQDWAAWDRARDEVVRVTTIAPEAHRYVTTGQRLATAAPEFWRVLSLERAEHAPDFSTVSRAWEWRQLDVWLSGILQQTSSATLQHQIEDLSRQRLSVMEDLVAVRALDGLVEGFTDRKRAALNKYLMGIRRFGRTGGKFAARWLREIREALDESKDAVPVWIMPSSRVLSSFRPGTTPPFDVLIVDEASQIGLLEIPLLALANKTIVVGDDQQTSPENVGLLRQPVFDLIDQHLADIDGARTLFDPDNSLYDMSRQKFPDVVVLLEHFRSLPPIISFSNRRYYDDRMIPLRDRAPHPGWRAVDTVFVEGGYRNGRDINEPEAQAVVDLIASLCQDSAYEGMTFGVISLVGHSQSLRIQEMLFDRLGPDVIEDRQIRCGEPADFQGDERDVVIISTVVDHPEGRRVAAMTDGRSERRLNVAASRAKNQMWVVHSIAAEDFPNGDPRAELIRHCQDPHSFDVALGDLAAKCESQFERDILRKILERGYRRVRAQHEVGQYRIDLVIEGPDARLAVECDGDAWHGADRWDDDRIRQQKLERSGWTFERIRASAFYRDPDLALAALWERLEELGIPAGDWASEPLAPMPNRVPSTYVTSAPTRDVPVAARDDGPRDSAVQADAGGGQLSLLNATDDESIERAPVDATPPAAALSASPAAEIKSYMPCEPPRV